MPKIYLASSIRDGGTYRVVIDGQQRISSILGFLRNEFALDEPFTGDQMGRFFSDLDREMQEHFLSYRIDFNEAINPSDEEVREVYARVNKYTVPLTRQELRRADFPGDFLDVSEELAVNDYFDRAGLFSAATRRRYADVEYVSELLAAMIGGVQDKKETLDDFYIGYASWEERDKEQVIDRFMVALREMELIFSREELPITDTRFRQKADFYSLFLVVETFTSQGKTVEGSELAPLRQDLAILDDNIRPESQVEICSEYAIKCVSQANSASSRRWRNQFLTPILSGTYTGGLPDSEGAMVLYKLMEDLSKDNSMGMCPALVFECPVCGQEIEHLPSEGVLAWKRAESVNQLSNADWIHRSCINSADHWLILERPSDEQPALF